MAIILCDIDGTLLAKTRPDTDARPSPRRRAINGALAAVCEAPGVDFQRAVVSGLTDWQIAEQAVRAVRPGFDLDGDTWRLVVARAEALFDAATPPGGPLYGALPGVPAVLHALRGDGHVLGIVTGNLPFFGYNKLAQAGIDAALFLGPTAFGDHARERAHLVRLAMAKAGCGAAPVLVLGDTARDRAGAVAAGAAFLGVGTTGMERAVALGDDGARADWLADLGDTEAVRRAVAGLASA